MYRAGGASRLRSSLNRLVYSRVLVKRLQPESSSITDSSLPLLVFIFLLKNLPNSTKGGEKEKRRRTEVQHEACSGRRAGQDGREDRTTKRGEGLFRLSS